MNYKKLLNYQQGLSLIEIMVAFTILVIAFIGLTQSFPYGLSITKSAENITIASYLAQAKIEELYYSGYSNISTGVIEEKHRLSDDQTNYLYFYQRQTEVSYVDGDLSESIEDTGMKKISVTVYYLNALSKTEKSYNITTLISSR